MMDERRQGWKIVQVGVEGLLASAVFLSHFSVQILGFGCLCWVFWIWCLELGLGLCWVYNRRLAASHKFRGFTDEKLVIMQACN